MWDFDVEEGCRRERSGRGVAMDAYVCHVPGGEEWKKRVRQASSGVSQGECAEGEMRAGRTSRHTIGEDD